MKISKYSALYSASVLTMSGLALQVLGFLYRILISRMTDAEGMGVYQLIFPFYSVIIAGSLLSGLTVAVTQLAAQCHVFGDWKGIGQLMRRCLCIFFCLFAVIAAVTLLFADFWAGTVLGDIRTKGAILLLLPCLLFTGVENTIKACFFGVKQVRPPITSELLEQTVRIAAVAVLLFTFRPSDPSMVAALIVCGMIVSEICSAVCLTLFYRRHIQGRQFTPEPRHVLPSGRSPSSYGLFRSICVIALPVAASAILNNFLSSADTVLIPKRLAVSGLGQDGALAAFGTMFGMTLPLVSLPTMFMGPLCNVLTPRLAESMALGNLEDVRRKISKALHLTGLMIFPATALLLPLGGIFGEWLFQSPAAADYLPALALASIPIYYQMVSGCVLSTIGLQRLSVINMVIGGLVQLGFTYFAAGSPLFGMNGFILGYFVSALLMTLFNMHFVRRKIKLRMQWIDWFLLPGLAAGVIGVTADLILRLLTSRGIVPLAAAAAAGMCGILINFVVLRVQGIQIRRYIRTLIPKSRRRTA